MMPTKNDATSVFISFHPQEENFNISLASLEKIMTSLFPQVSEQVFVSKSELEIVYRIQRPVFAFEGLRDFFLSLQQLMNATSDLMPHFTQYQDHERIKA